MFTVFYRFASRDKIRRPPYSTFFYRPLPLADTCTRQNVLWPPCPTGRELMLKLPICLLCLVINKNNEKTLFYAKLSNWSLHTPHKSFSSIEWIKILITSYQAIVLNEPHTWQDSVHIAKINIAYPVHMLKLFWYDHEADHLI